MKIALLTTFINSHETKAYHRTAAQQGIELETVPLQALMYQIDDQGQLSLRLTEQAVQYQQEAAAVSEQDKVKIKVAAPETDIASYQAAIPRGTVRAGEPSQRKMTFLLNEFFVQQQIPYLNGSLMEYYKGSKVWQHARFVRQGLPAVPTSWVGSRELLTEAAERIGFPLFVKQAVGKKGKNCYLVSDIHMLRALYDLVEEPPTLLLQKYLPTRQDLRIITVGGRVLGGIRRRAAAGSIVSNFSRGGDVEPAELTTEEKTLAEQVTAAVGADYGGVDLMRDEKGHLYVLEFNENAQFKGFQQATGIDVPQAVFSYIKEKVGG